MLTEVVIEDERWRTVGIGELAERAAQATLEHLGMAPGDWSISVLACDDSRISALNGDFRGKARSTNVLSWPSAERGGGAPGSRPDCPHSGSDPELGDIAIAYDTCAREAATAGKPMEEHVTHLVVHSVLHLLGYDHESDEDATLMEGTEIAILGKLGIDDPY